MKKKEIKSAGFCIVRPDLTKRNLSVPVGNTKFGETDAVPYRWLKDDEGFQVFCLGQWRDAESIDFEFLDKEQDIIKNVFKNYNYSGAIEEIKEWTAVQLKELLRHCGYKSWTKDINIDMVQDLARIHRFKIKLEKSNPFLVK